MLNAQVLPPILIYNDMFNVCDVSTLIITISFGKSESIKAELVSISWGSNGPSLKSCLLWWWKKEKIESKLRVLQQLFTSNHLAKIVKTADFGRHFMCRLFCWCAGVKSLKNRCTNITMNCSIWKINFLCHLFMNGWWYCKKLNHRLGVAMLSPYSKARALHMGQMGYCFFENWVLFCFERRKCQLAEKTS